jgi:ComF family protein
MDHPLMIESLLGSLCVLCLQRLHDHHHRRLQLCEHCLAGLPWNTESDSPELKAPITRQIAPLYYQDVAAAWVLKAKHHSGLVEARVLGTLLAAAVKESYSDLDPDLSLDLSLDLSPDLSPNISPNLLSNLLSNRRPDIIVPVPLSLRRLLARGHNQATLIAKPVSEAMAIPINQGLVKRVRHTSIQPGLDAAHRFNNLRRAFCCTVQLQGEVVAIIDDVVTSGATVTTLGQCLLAAGASEIHVWSPTRAQPAATLGPSCPG